MRGLFITFEGMDGVGKSTQIRLLTDYLRGERGLSVCCTREPGGCSISESIREILLSRENTAMVPETEALLYAAARAQLVNEVIQPRLNAGDILISDRFLESSLAYQGGGRQLGTDAILRLNDFALKGLRPDKTFFLCLDPEAAARRMNESKVLDRIESESAEYHRRVYETFVRLADIEDYVELIDVSGTKQETHRKIRAAVDGLLCSRGITAK